MNLLLLQIGVFIFGAIIGSFLNVVILRYGVKSLRGRSKCPVCGKKLKWFELIPIFSFLFFKGKCRNCQRKISWQYPMIETITGLLFLLIFNFSSFAESYGGQAFSVFSSQFLELIFLWLIFSLLIVIFVYDLYHKIIPDAFVFAFAGLSLARVMIDFNGFSWTADIWAGPILAIPFALLWLSSGGRWLGLGDAKLILGIGWFLGLAKGSSALILAIWAGALTGLILVALSRFLEKKQLFFKNKNFTIKSKLPFAPFLILGTALVFFFGWDVWGLSLIL
ncbi:MAG: prepilin peptidase [Candidatus Pacebacteria bacterium]|nr:prepilin peptidase [Candidatus Paceibacterota bacterium]